MKVKEKKELLQSLGLRMQKLHHSLNDVQRGHLIAQLRINERAKNALLAANYRTVSDLCLSDFEDLVRLKNVGEASLKDLCDDIEREYHVRHKSHTLDSLIADASTGIKYREVLFRRLGVQGFKRETLDAIGKSLSMTRERIRQIEVSATNEILSGLRGEEIREKVRFLAEDQSSPEAVKLLEGIDRPEKVLRVLLKSQAMEGRP